MIGKKTRKNKLCQTNSIKQLKFAMLFFAVDQGLPMLTPDQVDVNGNILPPKPQPMFGHSHGHPHGKF